MLNRDLDAEREIVLEWESVTPGRVLACETIDADRQRDGCFPVRLSPH